MSLESTMMWMRQAANIGKYSITRFLDPESEEDLRPDLPVCVRGRVFHPAPATTELVLEAVRSGAWFTYRRGFGEIGNTILTSDAGWGCMMRSGQMIIAQALLDVARQRRRESADGGSAEADSGGSSLAGYPHGWPEPPAWEADVLRLFADSAEAPFSIHRITIEGAAQGTPVGRWNAKGLAAIDESIPHLLAS